MDNRLCKFLKDFEVGKDDPFTHTSKIKPCRRYNIDYTKLESFYKIYNQVVSDGGMAGITEKPEPIVPLIVDVDFRYPLSDDGVVKRLYTPKHIKDIISIYHEIINELALEPTEQMFNCCVLEKSAPTPFDGRCKDGFHLHFPFFYTEHWVQKEIIRKEVIKRVNERHILDDIPILESMEKVFDKNIPNVTWLMYGSRKDISSEAYKVSKRYNKDLELVSVHEFFGDAADVKKFPEYLSLRQGFEPTELKDTVHDINHIPTKTKSFVKEYQRPLDVILSDLIIAEQLLPMLDDSRADDYTQWMEIGWVLFNISEGYEKGLQLWITFSGRSSKFMDGVCEKEWSNMTLKGMGLGTLKYFARSDSPQEFNSWKDSQIDQLLYQGISMDHNDIAKILYIMFENQYVCADLAKDIWYQFSGHRWVREEKAISLRKHMSHTLTNQYLKIAQKFLSKVQTEEDPAQRQMFTTKAELILKLTKKLKNNSFKNSVMKEAVEYFYNPKFVELMDENPKLFVCENGVYDTENKVFRDGRPDDFCTKSCGIYYREFESDDPRIIEMEEMFKRTFTNPKLYKFFRQSSSDLIQGGNRHKSFVIWSGKGLGNGDNGKSILADLIEKTFGDYYYSPPITLLTGKQGQSSGATAELAPLKGARIVVVSETDNNDVLNCGMMKRLTGGDAIYCRGLFKEPIKIIPQFKTLLHCNKLPNVSSEDKAAFARIKLLWFLSKFVNKEDAPKTIEEQFKKNLFPKDKTLKERLPNMAEPFLWWLIKAFEEFGDADLYSPPEVMNATQEYQKNNDYYLQFTEERIKKTEADEDSVSLSVIYNLFKDWYKESYPGVKVPNRQNVKEAFEIRFGPINKGIWKGYKVFDPNNDSDENTTPLEEIQPKQEKRLAPVRV